MVDTALVARSILLRCGALFWPTKANTGRTVTHVVAPSMRAKVPTAHDVHTLDPTADAKVPTPQAVHAVACRFWVENVPRGQLAHHAAVLAVYPTRMDG
jgi:hypothetical protein